MISLLQAIIAFVLLGLGTLYYFKTRSPPVITKSDDDDPLEDIKPKPEPTKTTPVVAKEPDVDQEPEILVTSAKPEDKPEDELVKPTPTTTPAKPIVPEKPKPTPKPVVTNVKRVLTNEEVDVFIGKIQKSIVVKSGQCQADAFKEAFRIILKDNQFDNKTIAKMLDPNRSSFSPFHAPGQGINDGYIPNDILPEYKEIYATQTRYALEKCRKEKENRPITNPVVVKPAPEPVKPTPTTTPAKPLVPPKPTGPPEPEFRMGWPDGTKWNLRGTTGGDTQRCNDICKSLGYNYFTHNPPPHDGGCGCSRSSKKLSQLNMTDHVNAKTRCVRAAEWTASQCIS